MTERYEFQEQPTFSNPTLLVGWAEDAGALSPRVIQYIREKLDARVFCEIDPVDFYSLSGVTVKDSIAQFPTNRFYYSARRDLILFLGTEPRHEAYAYLQIVLDVAEHYAKIKELITISGTISPIAHSNERGILAVYNQAEIQKTYRDTELEDMTWEGPPAINSYLLWAAKKRGIAGVSLWPTICFYLAGQKDPQAVKQALSFLDKKFHLTLDLQAIDSEIEEQNRKLAELREENPDINSTLGMLESGSPLDEEEQVELTRKVNEYLK
jgi:proteasome assembly chaperone (PAC2) family protein